MFFRADAIERRCQEVRILRFAQDDKCYRAGVMMMFRYSIGP